MLSFVLQSSDCPEIFGQIHMGTAADLLLADGPAVYRIVLHGPSTTGWNGNDLIPVVSGRKRPKLFMIPQVGHQQKG
jgi:hypothetical protein